MGDDLTDSKDEVNILEEILSNGDYVLQYLSEEFVEDPIESVAEEPPADVRGIKRPVEHDGYQGWLKSLRRKQLGVDVHRRHNKT